MKKIFILLAVLGVVGEGIYLVTRWSEGIGDPGQEFGMVPGGAVPKSMENDNYKSFSYWVNVDFPAPKTIQFYEEKLNAKGWTPFEVKGMSPQRVWLSSVRKDPQTFAPVCAYTYTAYWINAKKNLNASLILIYYDPQAGKVCPQAPKNRELLVTLQEMEATKI